MKPRNLALLAAAALALFLFIFFYERHTMTTEEARQKRERIFPDAEPQKIKQLVIHRKDGDIKLVKKSDDHWYLADPVSYRADDGKVSSTVSALANLRSKQKVEVSREKLGDFGLDKPEVSVELVEDDGKAYKLSFGNKVVVGHGRFATTDGRVVHAVPDWFYDDLVAGVDKWRSKKIVDVFAGDVASYELETSSYHISVARSSGGWKLLSPIQDTADKSKVNQLLYELAALKAEDFVKEGTDPAELGLDKPRWSAKLVLSKGKEPIVLEFGTKDGDKLAVRKDGKFLYWVKADLEDKLPASPKDWRSSALVPFDTWEAEAFTLVWDAGKLQVARNKEGVWECTGSSKTASSEVYNVLSSLSEMKIRSFDVAKPSGKPTVTAKIKLGKDEKATEVEVAFFYDKGAEAVEVPASVSNRPGFFSVDAGDLENLLELATKPCAEEGEGGGGKQTEKAKK